MLPNGTQVCLVPDIVAEIIKIVENMIEAENLQEPQKQALNIPVVMHWVSVSDKLPPKNKRVIGYFPRCDESGAKVATAVTYDGKKLRSDFPNSTSYCFEATYWMALPEPPCA